MAGKGLLDAALDSAASQSKRLARAKEQGYDVDNPVYHGTSAENIDAFDDSLIGSATDDGHYGRGIYFASNPGEARYYGPNVGKYYKRGNYLNLTNDSGDYTMLGHFKSFAPKLKEIGVLDESQKKALASYEKAENYVNENVRYINAQNSDGTEGVMARLKVDGPAQELSSRGGPRGLFPKTKEEALEGIKYEFYRHAQYNEPEKYPGLGTESASLSDYVRTDLGASNLTEAAKSAGYDGIIAGDETIVFDPKNIRSVDAEFDAAKKDSTNLLASPAPVTIGAGLLGNAAVQRFNEGVLGGADFLANAGSAVAEPFITAAQTLRALPTNTPTSEIEAQRAAYQNSLDYQPRTEIGRNATESALGLLGGALQGPMAAGKAIAEPLIPIYDAAAEQYKRLPRRVQLGAESLLDLF